MKAYRVSFRTSPEQVIVVVDSMMDACRDYPDAEAVELLGEVDRISPYKCSDCPYTDIREFRLGSLRTRGKEGVTWQTTE